MRVLLISSSYHPEIGPGSFRTSTILDALQLNNIPAIKIEVITAFPNKRTLKQYKAASIEHNKNVTIRRLTLPVIRPGFIFQILGFSVFAIKLMWLTRQKKYDLVVATSGRLMTGTMAAMIAKFSRAKFYLDLRENFPLNIKCLFKGMPGKLLGCIFNMVEAWTIKQADKINLISPGFAPHYKKAYPKKAFSYITHGISPLFNNFPVINKPHVNNSKLTVLYAGNAGYGQQLHTILPELAKRTADRLDFKVIASGNNLSTLKLKLQKENIHNVQLLPVLSRAELIEQYLNADILFLHLYPYRFAEHVLPSKLFEYAAAHKPIWAGVSGFAKQFIHSEISNCAIFKPCDTNDAIRSLNTLDLNATARQDFVNKYSQVQILQQLSDDIISVIKSNL